MIEKNKIYHESCLETMSRMEDNEVDIIVTSPPYNIGKSRMRGRQYTEYTDDLSVADYFAQTKEWIDESLRVAKYHVFWNIGEFKGNKGIIRFLLNEYHDKIKEQWIWAKPNPPCMSMSPSAANGYEYIICFSNLRPETKSFADYCNFTNKRGPDGQASAYLKNSLIHGVNSGRGNRVSDGEGGTLHGYAFAEWLPEYFISHFTKPGDTVYDPFMGTGTTAISAVKWNRNYIGSDIGESYIIHANNRIEQRKLDLEDEPFEVPPHFLETYE